MVKCLNMISLKSKEAKKILNYFFLNPKSRTYINELAKILNLDPKNTDRKLKQFEKEGLLNSDFEGKQRYFTINKSYPLLKEYKEIVLKTLGIEKELREIVANDKEIREAYIYGSYATDKMDANSDIDLLLVGNHSSIALQRRLLLIEKEIQREINVVSLSPEEFEKKKMESFVKSIMDGKYIKIK